MNINYPPRPNISAPVFNHHYEANTPLVRGRKIEALINSHLLKTYKEMALYRLFLNFTKNGKIININDNCNVDCLGYPSNEIPHSDIYESHILSHLQDYVNNSRLDIDLRDKDFKNQFELIKTILKPNKRLLIKTTINKHQPDLILDNMILDIKTHQNEFHVKDFIDQLIEQYIQFETFLNCPGIKFELDKKITNLVFQPVDTVGVYLWKTNQLFCFPISDLIRDKTEIEAAIKNAPSDRDFIRKNISKPR